MIENEKYDIFIAYHGNKSTGSESSAYELYEYIKDKEVYPGRAIRVYFHPETNPYGRFEDTPLIVARTPLFLMVVDKKIKRTVDGQLARQRDDGSLSNIYEEVRTFHDSPMYKSPGGDSAAKLFIADDLTFKEAERLHPIFSGRTALDTKTAVWDWITYFYQNTYISRLYNYYKYLANNKKEDFIKGDWVREAEDVWKYTLDEGLARTLMIYYIMKADLGEKESVVGLQLMYDKMKSLPRLESSTQNILYRIKAKYY